MSKSIQWRHPPTRAPREFGETIRFGTRRNGGFGYMSYSERSGPGVLILHEFFGLQPSFMSYADALQSEGFTVLVPDLYDGRVASTAEDAGALRDALDVDTTMKRLGAACDHLTANWHPRLGVIGFSMGADLAMRLVQQRAVEATIVYYGCSDVDPARWLGPIIGHFASDDDWTPLQEANELFGALSSADVDARMFVYEGAGHWFANESVPDAYDKAAAELAFERSAEFLRYQLA